VDDALAAALSSKRIKPGTDNNSTTTEISQKIWIPVDKNPGYNYIGLLIGPGGSKQRELVEQSGGHVKISIRGRGSSASNAIPGKPEEPLHVLLEGKEENVGIAERLINELLNDSEKAQAEKEKQLAVVSASTTSSSGTVGGGASAYQPKPVAQLLGLAGVYGPPATTDPTELIEEKIGIPNGVVGYIIGKGGESIASMQRKSGCRVQIQKEHEMEPGSTLRIITLVAATQESISSCRAIIEEMVQERLRLNQEQQNGHSRFGGGGGASIGPGSNAAAQAVQLQNALAMGQSHIKVAVPNNDVGLIIGKGGATIKSIQERSGANVQIPTGPDADNPMIRTLNITHPQLSGAEFAKTLIEEVLNSKVNHQQNYNNPYASTSYTPSSTDISIQIQIPDKDVGMCIGKQGCVIREIQQKTSTKLQIPSQPTPGQPNRIATVTGSVQGCTKVQEIINRIIMEQSSQFVMAGNIFQTGGQQQQQMYSQYANQYATTAQQGQVDYTAQWQAYYASLAQQQTTQQQSAQQTQAATATPVAAAAATTTTSGTAQTQQQPAADAYYDAFFRYAYHYGEETARQYYGAWSPPAGTPNPYGENPNKSTPTATSAATTGGDTTTTVNQSTNNTAVNPAEVKDTGARNVSNLPAWMTKS
jgi:far upstream element-binding protein